MTEPRSTEDDSAEGSGWNLLLLTPEYKEGEHKVYVDTLRKVIDQDKDKRVRNIALSGSYGVGKSSILDGLLKEYPKRAVMLSLPTLAPIKKGEAGTSLDGRTDSKTNQIQQEIVKQLLYREDPSKMPASRFRRIEPLRFWRVAGISLISAVVLTILFVITGWMEKLAVAAAPFVDLGNWLPFWFFVITLLGSSLLQYLTFGRIHIKQFSTGPATVTLGDGVASYFDQYLDEIVYFFQAHKKRNIVVFEDIDRFDDARIFETLRELNILINASPKLRSRDDPVRFIYATRDSIFDHKSLEKQDRDSDQAVKDLKDPAQIEAIRANRTKFFDLVIPVVPFISHQSAGDLTLRVLKDVDYKDDETLSFEGLLDIAVQTIPEMRLLTNIRNEFVVFRERIFSGDGERLELKDPQLFAMMIYKSTHLADFESIRYQQSNLDKLYEKQRELIRENTRSIQDEIRGLRDDLRSVRPDAGWSARSGATLLEYIKRSTRQVPYAWGTPDFIVKGVLYDEGALTTREFWAALISAPEDTSLTWRNAAYRGGQLTFGWDSIEAALGVTIDRAVWHEEERARVRSRIREKQNDLDFLKSADMGDLIKEETFKVSYDGESQSLAAVAEDVLEAKGLAHNLVRAGYIDSNFTLYTSMFHGTTFGPAATNFTIHHIKRNLMDEYFELSPADVAALIKGKPDDAMRESVYYNIHILDYLLRKDLSKADAMIRSFGVYKDEQLKMLQAYLDNGSRSEELIERLTKVSEGVTSYLVSTAKLDDSTRLKLVGVALSNFADDMDYDEIDDYLKDHYAELEVMTSDSTSKTQAKRIASWLEEGTFKAAELRLLGTNVQSAFIERGLFDINADNLKVISGDEEDLALDTIKDARPDAFTYLVLSLEEYLNTIQGLSPTVRRPDEYASAIGEVLGKADLEHVQRMIANASPDCVIESLEDVPQEVWEPLAFEKRFLTTAENVDKYIEKVGFLDQSIATLLKANKTLSEIDGLDEEGKTALAAIILNASTTLPEADVRVDLVESLALDDWIPVGSIPLENGYLYALLLEEDQIEDDEASYKRLLGLDWSSREAYISKSRKFHEYMTPALVGTDLANLFESQRVSDVVKERVVDGVELYLSASGDAGLAEIGKYAESHNFDVPLTVVRRLARAGKHPEVVVPLLSTHLEDIDQGELFPILQYLGGNYAKLTVIGHASPKFADTQSNQELFEKLKTLGTVASVNSEGEYLRVHMKRKR